MHLNNLLHLSLPTNVVMSTLVKVFSTFFQKGTPDLSYFSPDCFHFSVKGHAATAQSVWNNMVCESDPVCCHRNPIRGSSDPDGLPLPQDDVMLIHYDVILSQDDVTVTQHDVIAQCVLIRYLISILIYYIIYTAQYLSWYRYSLQERNDSLGSSTKIGVVLPLLIPIYSHIRTVWSKA